MAFLNKNIGIIRHFLKERDFIGNIGMLEGLWTATTNLIKEKKQILVKTPINLITIFSSFFFICAYTAASNYAIYL